tara:strand:+ start:641 stop:1612 length:972 start_codon:yes stop_codon:yes gene_type:complete
MSIFSAFNNLSTSVNSAFSNITSVASTINNVTSNINRASSSIDSFGYGGGITGTLSSISNIAGAVKNSVGAVDNLINGGGTVGQVGSAIRMIGNTSQGVGYNAAPPTRQLSKAIISSNITSKDPDDWRVSISVPSVLMKSGPITPLAGTGNKMIFPFTPTVLLSHSANYSKIQPVHTNYPYNAYESSQVDQYTIVGEFLNENQADAAYWLACLHFLRSATKMFYGNSSLVGQPPVVCRLNGYGEHVLNNIPVVITNFTTDLPADVDYIETTALSASGSKKNFVPAAVTMTVQCEPQYSRRSQAAFSLDDYVTGAHIGGSEGFV